MHHPRDTKLWVGMSSGPFVFHMCSSIKWVSRTAELQRCSAHGSVGPSSDTSYSACAVSLILLLVSSLCREQMKSSDIDQELFTESYCKVCSAQLISESQRVAHYEVGCSLVPLLYLSIISIEAPIISPSLPFPAAFCTRWHQLPHSQRITTPALKSPL